MIIEHYDVVRARVEADLRMSGRVFDVARLDGQNELVRDNYVIIAPAIPDLDDDRFSKIQEASDKATFVFDAKAVGVDPGGCAAVIDALITQLVGAKLTLTGRKLLPVTMSETDTIHMDDSVKPPLFYSDLEFTLVSLRS